MAVPTPDGLPVLLDAATNLFAAFGGAVVGAGVAGYIADKQSKAQQRRDEIALAFSVSVKLLKIANALHIIKLVAEQAKEAAVRVPDMPAWTRLIPSGNKFPTIEVDPREAALFLKGPNGLANDVLMAETLYADLIHLLALFGLERAEFARTYGAEMDGRVGSTLMTAEQMRQSGPQRVAMQDLAEAIIDRGPRDYAEIFATMKAVFDECRRRFGEDFPKIVTSAGVAPTAGPAPAA